jgi:hypothetical protein
LWVKKKYFKKENKLEENKESDINLKWVFIYQPLKALFQVNSLIHCV